MPDYVNDIYDIEKSFRAIEDELMASVIRNMKRHRAWEDNEGFRWSQWQVEQLKALEKYKVQNRKKFTGRFSDINKQIDAIITSARQEGGMDQEIAILKAIKQGHLAKKAGKSLNTTGEFFRLNTKKLDALIKATKDDFAKAEFAVLRQADDQYRKIIYNAQMFANSGAGTYEKAIDMATKDYLSRGITSIEYKNGARHTMSDYAGMYLRTATKRAYLTGEGEKRQEWGEHLVILNKRGNSCPSCLPFIGKILIDDVWSGGSAADGKYPLMSAAIEAGLYHPNCKDSHTTYFPELDDIEDEYSKKEVQQIKEDYNLEQMQKYNERMVQKYKNLRDGSLDPDNIQKYDRKLTEWKNKLKGIDISDDNVIIKAKRDGAGRAADYEEYWQSVSLNEVLKQLLVNPIATGVNTKGKIIYSSSETPVRIVYDVNGNYFRIQNTSMDGKNNYLDINGNAAFNITENGKTRGRSKSEFQAVTHFKNKDKR